MNRLPIRFKLAFLAGTPVLGALVLALLLVFGAQEQLRRTEALGSVEHLAELSTRVSHLVRELQQERAMVALELGKRRPKSDADFVDDFIDETKSARAAAKAAPAPSASASATRPTAPPKAQLSQYDETDAALRELNEFLATRDISRLPKRLADDLAQARKHLSKLTETREKAHKLEIEVGALLDFYRSANLSLIQATAALTELTDDGELLRVITSLVSILSLEERASQEHALLAHVFAVGEFPPGTYRTLVTLVTEEKTFVDVFRTNAGRDQVIALEQANGGKAVRRASTMRTKAIKSTEGEMGLAADEWFKAQGEKVDRLRQLEQSLNRRVKEQALSKIASTQRQVALSLGLSGGILVLSMVMTWFIGRGLLASVRELRTASQKIAEGDLSVRVAVASGDELGELGATFNHMTSELDLARSAVEEQARMARELEIAATIQQAMLPPNPNHPEFEFAGRMLPADEVGGDYYDVLHDPTTDHLWLTVGDVSGHGLPAGLVMLMAQSAFGSFFRARPEAEPDVVLHGVNGLLCENITVRLKDNKYITGQLLTYRGDGNFHCAGAHEWPIVYRAGTERAESIEAVGPWLGIMDELDDVPVSRLHLAVGDILCLYSDGLTEARDEAGELFDVARFEAALARAAGRHDDLQDIADDVFAQVDQYAAGREDDWSMLLVRRLDAKSPRLSRA